MCLAQKPQRKEAGEAQTRVLTVSSQALYHWAPTPHYYKNLDTTINNTVMWIWKKITMEFYEGIITQFDQPGFNSIYFVFNPFHSGMLIE